MNTDAPLRVLAGFQARTTVRSRWVLWAAAAFTATGMAVTVHGLRSQRSLGLAGSGAVTDALLGVSLLLPPLLALLLGAGSLAGDRERGLLALLAAQPLRRSALVWSTFTGLTAVVWSTVGVAFSLVGLVVAGVARAGDLAPLVVLVLVTLGVTACCVAMGVALSVLATSRTQATSAAVTLWFVLAFGLDLAVAGAAPALSLGARGLLVAVLANPLESARVLALLGSGGDGAALGPFGSYVLARFGRAGSAAVLATALAGWTALALALARWRLDRRDV